MGVGLAQRVASSWTLTPSGLLAKPAGCMGAGVLFLGVQARARGGGECGRFPASRPCNGGAPLPRRAHQSPSPVDNCGRHRRRRFRGRSSRRAAAGPRCSVPAYLVGSSYFRLFPPTPPYSQFCLHPAVVHASAPTRQSPCRLSVRLLCSQSVGITPPLFCIPIGPPAHCSALPPPPAPHHPSPRLPSP